MKMMTMTMAICMTCLVTFALDTATPNEYWCTWGYVNSTPITQSSNSEVDFEVQVHDLENVECSVDFSSVIFDILMACPGDRFSSFPPVGFKIFFR